MLYEAMTKIQVSKYQSGGDNMFVGRYVHIANRVYSVSKILDQNEHKYIVEGNPKPDMPCMPGVCLRGTTVKA